MKKILLTAAIFFFIPFAHKAFSQEINIPTDEEIWATIKKFNIDKSQEQYVFEETKRKLIEIYANKENLPEIENIDINNFGQELEKQTIENVGSSNYKKRKYK